MLLKVFAGVLVAVAVVFAGMALTGHGHCPFSSGCCGTAPEQTVSETSCCTSDADCCTKKAGCCEEEKVAGEDK
jgi:hypothetical protein